MDVIKINFSSCIRHSKHDMKTSPSVYMYLEMKKKTYWSGFLLTSGCSHHESTTAARSSSCKTIWSECRLSVMLMLSYKTKLKNA